jgi:glyoxylate reductase
VARFVVLRALPEPALALLREAGDVWVSPHDRPLEAAEAHAAVAGADAVLALLHDRVDDALLAAAGPGLRCVANVAVGVDHVDLEAARARGVRVTNTPGVLTDATADLAIALTLMVTRRLGEGERRVRSGEPWSWSMGFLLGRGLQGTTLGIVGLGAIGRATARRARAFGIRIAYAGPRAAPEEVERELGAVRLGVDELFARADVVSLHCPLSHATRHLADARRLASMREGAFLVNTARGPVVDEAALVAALDDGPLAGAALDVYEDEPRVHPALLGRDDVVLLPHLGSATVQTREAMALLAARNAIATVRGEEPLTPVG